LSQTPDIAAGRLPPERYGLNFADLHPPLRPREARVAAAMRQLPDGTPEDWLPIAYADVPERMWPVAARSLEAHVERIRLLSQT
jgi:hypothetical protein